MSLRRRLAAALAAVTLPDLGEEEEELLEELDTDGFTFDEVRARTSSRVLCKQHFDIYLLCMTLPCCVTCCCTEKTQIQLIVFAKFP